MATQYHNIGMAAKLYQGEGGDGKVVEEVRSVLNGVNFSAVDDGGKIKYMGQGKVINF